MDLTAYDPTTLTHLTTYEDFLSYYIQIDEVHSGFSWIKADLISKMVKQLGSRSIEQLSKDLKKPRSTISNYSRVSLAFPSETRSPALSFSAHFQASYADSFNEKTREFKTKKRFEWINKAADEHLSTRQIQKQIQAEKTDETSSPSVQEIEQLHREIKRKNEELRVRALQDDKEALSHLRMIHKFIYGQENSSDKTP